MIVSTVSELTKESPEEGKDRRSKNRPPAESSKERPSAGLMGLTRRRICGGVAAVCLSLAAAGYWTGAIETWTGSDSTSRFVVSAMTRIGMVFGALWLAWDSLSRPARWLPPGLAVLGVLGLVVVAAQPKLVFVILPLVGVITVFTSLLRVFRRD